MGLISQAGADRLRVLWHRGQPGHPLQAAARRGRRALEAPATAYDRHGCEQFFTEPIGHLHCGYFMLIGLYDSKNPFHFFGVLVAEHRTNTLAWRRPNECRGCLRAAISTFERELAGQHQLRLQLPTELKHFRNGRRRADGA